MIRRFILGLFLGGLITLPLWASTASWPGQEIVHQLNLLGVRDYERNDYAKAAGIFEQALKAHAAFKTPQDLSYGQVLHNLATAYFYLGERQKAVPLFLEAASIRERYLGGNHPEVAQTLSNLAILYLFDRNYDQAEPLFQRALQIRGTVLGPEHVETARTLHDLAELYRKKGNYGEALALHDEALRIRLKSEPGSQFTGASYYHRGEIFQAEHRVAEATEAYRKAYEILKAALGPGHFFTKMAAGRLYEITHGTEGVFSPRCEAAKAMETTDHRLQT
ncbi:MAG: tetratricopeptide repeat protein [Candidatus Omnitrophica bacterium]|nr:tetratricopeptide repeat protein [Candidatus Omnitrophota bacterium]MDD5672287.1 tetratricopeptide repeat protein [Candidatus Omnitrophota bacterium]